MSERNKTKYQKKGGTVAKTQKNFSRIPPHKPPKTTKNSSNNRTH